MNKKYRIYYRFFQYLLIMVLFIVFYKCKITAKAATANDVVSLANSQVGIGGCPNKYTKDLGPIGGSYDYYWCHAFVSWVAKYAGAGDIIPRTASCEVGVNWFKARERWMEVVDIYLDRVILFILIGIMVGLYMIMLELYCL